MDSSAPAPAPRTGAALSAVLMSLLLAALVLPGSGPPDEVPPSALPGTAGQPEPGAPDAAVRRPLPARAVAPVAGRPARRTAREAGPVRVRAAAAPPARRGSPAPVAEPDEPDARPYGPLSRTRKPRGPQERCGTAGGLPAAPGTCPREGADVGLPQQGRRTVGFHSCADADQGRRLRFAGGDEVLLTVRDASGAVVWRWQPAQPAPNGPHAELLAPDQCLSWSTVWAHVDDAGRPVPPGVYSLVVDYLEVDDHRDHRTTFTT